MTTVVVSFTHPMTRRTVRRTLCGPHQATAAAMLDDVAVSGGSFHRCEWCGCEDLKIADRLRDRVANERQASIREGIPIMVFA